MRRIVFNVLSALLALLLCMSAFAEGNLSSGASVKDPPAGAAEVETEQIDPEVEELGEIDLFTGDEGPSAPSVESFDAEPGAENGSDYAVLAPEADQEGAQAEEETPPSADSSETEEETPPPADISETEEEEQPLVVFGGAMEPRGISVKKKATRTVYIGVPYQISVPGKTIKSCKSASKKIASVTSSGLLTPNKKGKTKITVKTGKKTIALTLKVKKAPAPRSLKASVSKGVFKLSWGAAKVATGYLVQISEDNKKWDDYKVVTETSLDITSAATGTRYFQVKTILGDHFGGCSGVVSILKPVTSIKVICEEAKLSGPTNKLNVTWTGTVGATAYEVYRAELPSEDYQLIGTTTNTYYPDKRTATTLYSYRVRAVFGESRTALSAPANLWTGMQENVLPPSNITSKTGIVLLVNKKAQVVTAYVKDASGKYTIPLRHMLCSTGRVYGRTKNGTYKLKARRGEWYRYPSGVYIRYPSIYREGYYFHSPLYNGDKTIRSATVYKLGSRQSLGCVRLKVRDAEWVYKHCKAGTTVYICDGKKRTTLRNAIKPRNVKVKGF